MTNMEIIMEVMATQNIDEELNTFSRWKSLGYRVKSGEHGIETRLWKKTKRKNEAPADSDEETKKKYSDGFYLAKSYLFKKSQVEKIQEGDNDTRTN